MGVAGRRPAVSLCARHWISRQVLGSHHPYVPGAPLPGVGRAGPRPQQRPRASLPLANLWTRHGVSGRTLGPARGRRHRPFQRRSHHRPGGRVAPAHLSRAALAGSHHFPAGVLRHGTAGRRLHPSQAQCMGIAGRDVRALQRPSALCSLAAGDPARLLRVRRAAARRTVRTRLSARCGGIYL